MKYAGPLMVGISTAIIYLIATALGAPIEIILIIIWIPFLVDLLIFVKEKILYNHKLKELEELTFNYLKNRNHQDNLNRRRYYSPYDIGIVLTNEENEQIKKLYDQIAKIKEEAILRADKENEEVI